MILARHGETRFNLQHRMQGLCDSPLSPAGETGAKALGLRLCDAGLAVDSMFSADAGRHRRTAELVLRAFPGVNSIETAALHECDFGGEDIHLQQPGSPSLAISSGITVLALLRRLQVTAPGFERGMQNCAHLMLVRSEHDWRLENGPSPHCVRDMHNVRQNRSKSRTHCISHAQCRSRAVWHLTSPARVARLAMHDPDIPRHLTGPQGAPGVRHRTRHLTLGWSRSAAIPRRRSRQIIADAKGPT